MSQLCGICGSNKYQNIGMAEEHLICTKCRAHYWKSEWIDSKTWFNWINDQMMQGTE